MTADDLRAMSAAATPGPWEAGDIWSWAGCGFNGNGPDECVLCAHMGEPVWAGKANINGKRMHAHKHRNPRPYAIDHRISGPDGEVAGNYDYEEGGIINPVDLALIVWLRNHADALAALIDAALALEDEPWAECAEDDNACLEHFDEPWPCRGVRFRAALTGLDADT